MIQLLWIQLLWIQLLIILLYLIYVQFSPYIGNIWWRDDYFSPMGAIKIMIYPLQEIYMWYPELWDMNVFIWILFGAICYKVWGIIPCRSII